MEQAAQETGVAQAPQTVLEAMEATLHARVAWEKARYEQLSSYIQSVVEGDAPPEEQENHQAREALKVRVAQAALVLREALAAFETLAERVAKEMEQAMRAAHKAWEEDEQKKKERGSGQELESQDVWDAPLARAAREANIAMREAREEAEVAREEREGWEEFLEMDALSHICYLRKQFMEDYYQA